ncbi:MAG: hypothetical protein CSA20_08810 [Deltaproteobacteria bacterium]|nr:MAG: hypothetical protein CSA20_08810 [Deltaproteobacteria bacterium]
MSIVKHDPFVKYKGSESKFFCTVLALPQIMVSRVEKCLRGCFFFHLSAIHDRKIHFPLPFGRR